MKTFYRNSDFEKRIQTIYEQIISGWVQPHELSMVPTRHGSTFVITSGPKEAPPVVLLHGSGSNSYMWAEEARLYSSVMRVFAVDIPGEAGKSESVRASWDSDDFVEWMEDLYAGLGLQRAAIIGISLGGWIAAKWAIAHPDRVEQLVLLCPSGFAPPRASFLPKIVMYSLLGEYGMGRIEDLIFGAVQRTPEVSAYFRVMAKGFLPRQGVPPLFTDEEIRRLTMAVLVIIGSRDALIDGPASIERIARLLKHAETRLEEGVGHAVTGVSGIIMPFLARSGDQGRNRS